MQNISIENKTLIYFCIICQFARLTRVFIETITFQGNSNLWFLPTLYFSEVLALLISKVKKTKNVIFIFTVIILQIIFFYTSRNLSLLFIIWIFSAIISFITSVFISKYFNFINKCPVQKDKKKNELQK